MKILAVYNPLSGGSYHRVKLWSEFVEGVTLVEELTEELVSQCDILYIHWNSKTAITDLSIWREKYKFKIIADIDDTWQLEKKYDFSVFLSQNLCRLADHVIVTIESLVKEVSEFNKNVTVIPNYIPAGHGQFKPIVKKHSKIRVGIGGSISHYHDYKSIGWLIRHLEKNQWFNDNCEFAIIGYDHTDERWRDVAKMFRKVKLFKAQPAESYMNLYGNLDVMLLPLMKNPVNENRSSLKILECFASNVVPFASDLYSEKMDIPRNRPIWALKAVSFGPLNEFKKFKYDQYFKQLQYLSQLDYQSNCVDKRVNLFKEVLERSPEGFNHDLYSITYSPNQDVEYKRIANRISTIEEKSYLFEYNKIIEYTECWETYNKDSYLGFFSHKFPHKTGFYKKYVEEILNNEDSDVVIFCKQIPDYLNWSEAQHPGLLSILRKVCTKLGLGIEHGIPVVYSNFFVAKAEAYKEYVEVLKKAIDIMETDSEIKELCWKNTNYIGGLDSDQLFKYTGLKYYTFHTFVLERLISIWISNKGLSHAIYT